MKILLINDTSEDNNPGCKATVSGLNSLFNSNDIIYRYPKTFGYKYFLNCYKNLQNKKGPLIRRFYHVINKLNLKKTLNFDYGEPKVSLNLWIHALEKLEWQESIFLKILIDVDKVILNMEGTIHHNSIGGVTLLAIAYLAKKHDKKVLMVNGSIQAMDEELLSMVLKQVDYISVREPLSLRYLDSIGIKAHLAADCAFLSNINVEFDFSKRIEKLSRNSCLFTPGILASDYKNNHRYIEDIKEQLSLMIDEGINLVYFRVDQSEGENILFLMKELKIPIIYSSEIPWSSIGSFLQKFKMIISGRYHILIFAIMTNMPILPLISNSWKIEGLMELISQKPITVGNYNDFFVSNDFQKVTRVNYNHEYFFGLAKRNFDMQ